MVLTVHLWNVAPAGASDDLAFLFVVKADKLNLSAAVGSVLNPLMASRVSSCEH
jgi:hypothetical protein